MCCTTSETEGAVVYFITDRSKAVVLSWFSFACFGVRVSVTFHLTCVHLNFSSVWVAEWLPFGK